MCTSFTLPRPDGTQLFGRTLDWHEHFDERILRTPRGFPFGGGRAENRPFPDGLPAETRYATVGMGTEAAGYPLYADGFNERGLCIAGLRFAEGTHYMAATATLPDCVIGLAPWELIPCVLGLCGDLDEARALLSRVRVMGLPFYLPSGETVPISPLHWMIADGGAAGEALVVEATARGLEIYDAPLGVMTNDPPYPEQTATCEQLLRDGEALPDGYTSPARFVRAVSLRREAEEGLADQEGSDPVARFFAVAGEVSPPEGATRAITGHGWQITQYTCCMDGARGRYYYTTAEEPRIREESFDRS